MSLLRTLVRWRRGIVADVLVIVALWLGSAVVTATPPQAPATEVTRANPDSEVLQYVKEGGMFSVLLTVLFFYRRDWKALTEGVQAANVDLTALVRESTRAQSTMEGTIRENSVITHRLARMLEATLSSGQYGRRMLDGNGDRTE